MNKQDNWNLQTPPAVPVLPEQLQSHSIASQYPATHSWLIINIIVLAGHKIFSRNF